MREFHNLTSEVIQQRFHLPKMAAKKIVESNKYMQDPNSTLTKLLEKQENKRKKMISNRLNGKKLGKFIPSNYQQRDALESHLRKFSPSNSSLSALKEHQRKIENQKNHSFLPKPNLDHKSSPGLHQRLSALQKPTSLERKQLSLGKKQQSIKKQKTISPQISLARQSPLKKIPLELHSLRKQTTMNTSSQKFSVRLKDIRMNSQFLQQNTKPLKRKVWLASNINDLSYERINQHSNQIFLGYQRHSVQQEFNPAYRDDLIELRFDVHKLTQKRK